MAARNGGVFGFGLVVMGVAMSCGGSVERLDDDDTSSGGANSDASSADGSNGSDGRTAGSDSGSGGSSQSTSRSVASSASSDTVTGGVVTSGAVTNGASSGSGGSGGAAVSVVTGVTGVTSGMGFGAVTTGSSVGGGSVGGAGGGEMVDYGDIPIPEDCLTRYRSGSAEYCDLELQCSNDWMWTYCWNEGNRWQCDCQAMFGYSNIGLVGVSNATACPYSAAVCLGALEPEFGEPMCQTRYQEMQRDYCSSEVECTSQAMLDDGVTATRTEWRWSSCYRSGTGLSCECQLPNRYLQFELGSQVDTAAACGSVADWCEGDIERTGDAECAPVSQSAGLDYCNAQLECLQPAQVEGIDIRVREYLSLDCRPAGEGAWDCSCPGSDGFQVMSSSAWDACTLATSVCMEGD